MALTDFRAINLYSSEGSRKKLCGHPEWATLAENDEVITFVVIVL